MVIADRLRTLRQYVEEGRDVMLVYTFSQQSKRLKLKVKVGSLCNIVPLHFWPLLSAALDPLEGMLGEIVTDHGHKLQLHNSGWIKLPTVNLLHL